MSPGTQSCKTSIDPANSVRPRAITIGMRSTEIRARRQMRARSFLRPGRQPRQNRRNARNSRRRTAFLLLRPGRRRRSDSPHSRNPIIVARGVGGDREEDGVLPRRALVAQAIAPSANAIADRQRIKAEPAVGIADERDIAGSTPMRAARSEAAPASMPEGQLLVARSNFMRMFQAEINDANTASVVSGALGIPIFTLAAGIKRLAGENVTVNQSQLTKQQPNIRKFVQTIE